MSGSASGVNARPDYDAIADFYRKHWCDHYHTGLESMMQRLLLARLQPGSRILDLCCGTGTVARHLLSMGFRVTGIDASEKMLRHAAREAPIGAFLLADARQFALAPIFDAAVCTFDSLSYILDLQDLHRVFSNVWAALQPGALFLFDASLEEAFKTEWQKCCVIIEENEACFVRGQYDERHRSGTTLITRFHRNGEWTRTDVEFRVRCYSPEEVVNALNQAGFSESVCHRSDLDEELRSELGPARACFVAAKDE
jgi:SAM-dependent methyltransferase